MPVSSNAPRAQQVNCDSPKFFVATKHGWQRHVPPCGDAPFAVRIKGKWHLVFRATTDAEFFAAHPDSPYRLTVRRHNHRDFFEVGLVARDGNLCGFSDCYDLGSKLNQAGGGTRRERLKAAVDLLIADQNRYRRVA